MISELVNQQLNMYIITTKDGSHSLFSEKYEEIYHSGNGAIQESAHVFIHSGFEYAWQSFGSKLRIFEVGFGTGLNALLTVIEAQSRRVDVYYETIEQYPVPIEVIKELNYTAILENEKYRPPFHSMHLSNWNVVHSITPYFAFKKNQADFLKFEMPSDAFHLIYFDAFAPENQPEMWTVEVIKKLNQALEPNGILVSYCSKSAFRKTLAEAGFMVEKLPGPPGKREMVRAIKK
jgi:tRNA U34 5-methylaminomethyl-2-thiouridine-forming methyltransferase MnmC